MRLFTHRPAVQTTIDRRLAEESDAVQARTILRGVVQEQEWFVQQTACCPTCQTIFDVSEPARLTFWQELAKAFLLRYDKKEQ